MKRIIITIILAFILIEAISQVRPARRRHYRAFEESTTLIVIDANPFTDFNDRLKEELDRFWTITPYEFITFDEFQRKRTSDKYSFMVLAEIKQRNVPHVYKFINFVLGDPDRDFNRMPDLGSAPLAFKDADEETYLYKMGTFVQFMQNYAEEAGRQQHMRLTRFLNVRDSHVQEMELWLLEEELAPQINTVEKIQEYYPYPVRIVTKEDIRDAISQQREDVAFLHKIGPKGTVRVGKCWKFIVTTDGKVLYSNDHHVDATTYDALLIEDLERMAR